MLPLARAVRFLLSPRGRAVIALAKRARAAGRDWYPVRVEGVSMLPTLRPGDMLAVRFPRAGEPVRGQIVVAATDERELVKRVIAGPGERGLGPDEFWLEGDNVRVSSDSRARGPVPRAAILGIVRARYWPARSARRF